MSTSKRGDVHVALTPELAPSISTRPRTGCRLHAAVVTAATFAPLGHGGDSGEPGASRA